MRRTEERWAHSVSERVRVARARSLALRAHRMAWGGVVACGLCSSPFALQDQESPTEIVPPTASVPAAPEHNRGTLTLSHDNDIVLFKDNNYSAGIGVEWVTGELSAASEANVFRQLRDVFDGLPGMGGRGRRTYASAALNYEIFTPDDIDANPPPADQQPYAGIAALDLGLFSRSENSVHAYGARLGLVGPATGADGLQEWLHGLTGSDVPQGWEHQLSNEPLVNVFYRYQRRIARGETKSRFGFDSMWDVGGGLGNYYTGAAASASVRFGYNVPEYHSINLVPTTRQVMVGIARPQPGEFSAFMNLYVQSMATARYLPTDGNTFTDSASIERDPLSGDATLGLFLMYSRFTLGFEIHNASDAFQDDINRNREYGSIRFSWIY